MALIIEGAFGVYPTIVIIRNPHNSIIRKVYKGGKLFIEEFWPGPGIGDSSSVGVLPSTKPPVPHKGTLTIGAGFFVVSCTIIPELDWKGYIFE